MDVSNGRRKPVRLSAETEWEIFLAIAQGEVSQAETARRWRGDVSVIIAIRRSVKDAALAAPAVHPGPCRVRRRPRRRGPHRLDLPLTDERLDLPLDAPPRRKNS